MNAYRKYATLLMLTSFAVMAYASSPSMAAADLGDPRTMEFAPVEFKPPLAERVVLANGMVIYLLEDHELPLIQIHAMIRAARIYESADQAGLAELAGGVMRTGGTRRMSGDEVDEELEFLAARIETGIGMDAAYASLDVLAKDLERGLELFSEIIRYPDFASDKLELAKNQFIENIRRKNDYAAGIARREFVKLLYGEAHPYAREARIETVSSIKREDLVSLHQRYFHPNAIIMGITGDFRKEEMMRRIKKVFGSWEPIDIRYPPVAPVAPGFESSVNYIYRDLTQTHLRLGHLGIRQDNPDFFALSVMNDILGGQPFTSRLFQEVRTRRGLAYSVGTVLSPGNFEVGTFYAYAQTRAELTLQSVSTILDEVKRIRSEPVSESELQEAKESFLNSHVFSFSSPAQVVNRQVALEYYGLPADFLEQYRENVGRVTPEDILRVARQYLHPDGMILLAVGNQARFDQPLSALGEVRTIALEEIGPAAGREDRPEPGAELE